MSLSSTSSNIPVTDAEGGPFLGDLLGLLLPGRNALGTRICCQHENAWFTEIHASISVLRVVELQYLDRSVKLLGSSHVVDGVYLVNPGLHKTGLMFFGCARASRSASGSACL